MILVVVGFFLGILSLNFFRELPTIQEMGIIFLVYIILKYINIIQINFN